LLDSVKNVEENFSNLKFLQDLPDMIQFPSEDITDSQVTPEPELASKEIQSINKKDALQYEQINVPNEMEKNQPETFQQLKGVSALQYYFHNHIAKPFLEPPAPGHTTFTIQLEDQTLKGFHQSSKETRSLKELVPILSNKTKQLMKSLKNRDFKKDIKNIKNLPNTIKKTFSKINSNSAKTLPKKLRSLFSSD